MKFIWVRKFNDEVVGVSAGYFTNQPECYNDMREDAIKHAKLNTKYTDFDGSKAKKEAGVMVVDDPIYHRFAFYPNKIVHRAGESTYTYTIMTAETNYVAHGWTVDDNGNTSRTIIDETHATRYHATMALVAALYNELQDGDSENGGKGSLYNCADDIFKTLFNGGTYYYADCRFKVEAKDALPIKLP